MRRTALAIVAGLVLAAIGFTAAAFASGHSSSSSDTTTTTTGSTTATTGTTTSTTPTTTSPATTMAPTTTTSASHKVLVCHRTGSRTNPFVTISIDRHALRAHMRHGDKPGACSATQTVPTTTGASTSATTTGTTAATTTTSTSHARFHKQVKCSVVFVRVGGKHHRHHR